MIGGFGPRRLSVCFILVLVASACGSSALDHHPAPASSKQPAIDGTLSAGAVASLAGLTSESHLPSGVSLFPIKIPTFVFGPEVATQPVQSASVELANLVPNLPRLHVVALPSPAHTAALNLVEDSTPRLKWGELLTPAQRTVFRAFASDPSLGNWLVIVDDVNVKGGIDPIPLTAYLWPRSALTTYLQCGIPNTGIDACTDAFYTKAFMVLVSAGNGTSAR